MEVFVASPRGFCAGVVRAIDIVEIALKRFGAPVYVKHQIVHKSICRWFPGGKGCSNCRWY